MNRTAFAKLLADFKQQWQIDALFVADAALYTNLQQMQDLRWVSSSYPRICLIRKMSEDAFGDSALSGYRVGSCCSDYGDVQQRWIVVESQARQLTLNNLTNAWRNNC